MIMNKWTANSSEEGQRLLTFLREKAGAAFSTKNLRWAVEHHRCRINGVVERFCSRRLKKGDVVEVSLVEQPTFAFDPSKVLFEDETLLFYNKPPGISSEELASSFSLFLAHRLDRDTSGVLLLAKTPAALKEIESLFRERKIKKEYAAIVIGALQKAEGVIENYLAKIGEKEGEGKWGIVPKNKGLYAKTEWSLEKISQHYSFVRCYPLTGRTHQLRIHLSSIGHPIAGDLRYGNRLFQGFQPFRPLLHAENLSFIHPKTQQKIAISAPLPKDFLEVLASRFNSR